MVRGEGDVVSGWKNEPPAAAEVLPCQRMFSSSTARWPNPIA